MVYRRVLAIVWFLLAGIAFASGTVIQHVDALVVAPDATEIAFKTVEGTQQVYYNCRVPYPANGVIEFIGSELLSAGWSPREESYLNPGSPTSQVKGWGKFLDETKEEPEVVHQWWGEWQRPDGSVVIYILRYAYPEDSQPDLVNLSVVGIHNPAERVEAWKHLLPYFEAEEVMESRKIQKRERLEAEKIRKESTTIGWMTLRVVGAFQETPNAGSYPVGGRGQVDFDDSVRPLRVGVAAAAVETRGTSSAAVKVVFTEEAAESLREFSAKNLNRRIAIMVHGEVLSMPVLRGEIGDSAIIDGDFSVEDAERLVRSIMNR